MALVRGESRAVLLSGVALNWIGAAKFAREVFWTPARVDAPGDYDQFKAFTAGAAATFGVSNGIVAGFFWARIVRSAIASRAH
jgi:hypothetical protein